MRRGPTAIFVGAGVAVAVALRVWVLTSPFGAVDGDEAVWGLMARHVREGELSVFFWDQAYGGTHEVFLTAPVFALVGSSAVALRVVPLALFALATALVWRIGRRTVGDRSAVIGAVLFALWPAYVIWKSTKAHGFYGSGLVLSLLVLLLALRLAERESLVDLAGLGLAAGLGWWATPQTAFVCLPALVWLAWRRPALLRRGWIAVLAAVVGALPWLVWNFANDWASLASPFGRGEDAYFDHLRTFAYATFPTLLGLRVPFSLEWLTGELVGRLVEMVAFVGVVWLAFRRHTLLLAVLLVYPFLVAFGPHAALNEEPRYLVLLVPVIALLLGDVLARSRWTAFAGTSAIAALSIAGLAGMSRQQPPVPPIGGIRAPADLAPVIRTLDAAGVRYALAPYPTAYRITFETDERIVASSTTHVRYEPHDRLVRSQRPAYVFIAGERLEETSSAALVRRGYRRVRAEPWSVYLPPSAS